MWGSQNCCRLLQGSADSFGDGFSSVAFVSSFRRPMNAQTDFLPCCHTGGWPAWFVPFARWPGARRVLSKSWRASLTAEQVASVGRDGVVTVET